MFIDYDALFETHILYNALATPGLDSTFEILFAVYFVAFLLLWLLQVLKLFRIAAKHWKTKRFFLNVLQV